MFLCGKLRNLWLGKTARLILEAWLYERGEDEKVKRNCKLSVERAERKTYSLRKPASCKDMGHGVAERAGESVGRVEQLCRLWRHGCMDVAEAEM